MNNLTLLIDLDDTLLDNDVDIFLPAYLQAYSEHVSSIIEPEIFIQSLITGTQFMIDNQVPDCTLQEVFESYFYPATGLSKSVFEPLADEFYEKIYPGLQDLTHPIPGAIRFVEEAIGRGYRLVIATNPLFPRTAILQRLEWAGLPVEHYKFDLVASFEMFHFVKPQPAYFAEVMGYLGWPDGPVVVVGDDHERDIVAADQMGLASYWIDFRKKKSEFETSHAFQEGSIHSILAWVDSIGNGSLSPNYNSRESLLAILRSTPAVLDKLCRDIFDQDLAKRPHRDEWSPTEILCHLRDVDVEVNLPRIKRLIAEKTPFILGQDTDPWADERNYICQDGFQALGDFISVRMNILEILESLPVDQWRNPANHSILGRTDLRELVSILASHDRMHIQQISKIL